MDKILSSLRVAIVHYWFVGRAGGERVVETLAEMLPQADLFCLLADTATLSPALRARKIHTSFLQHFPGATKLHRYLLFLHPLALEQFDFGAYDLVISSESGPAQGVITPSRTCHVCYCHSPMRYIWDMHSTYKRGMSGIIRPLFALAAHYMRLWDYAAAGRVDYFVANSQFIAGRIRKYYRRNCTVIYPPVETGTAACAVRAGDYYTAIGRLVDYKRFDLAVRACTELGRSLTVIGDGPEYKRLKRLAGPTITFLGAVSDSELRSNMAGARALLFPGEEDFGIVPVEAQSLGRPVIAYGSGGALETVRGDWAAEPPIDAPTGVFFDEQTPAKLAEAIVRFESTQDRFSPSKIRAHALQFDTSVFKSRMAEFLISTMAHFKSGSSDSHFRRIEAKRHSLTARNDSRAYFPERVCSSDLAVRRI